MADIIADAGASLVVASPDLAAGLQAALAAVPAGAGAAEARPVVVIGEPRVMNRRLTAQAGTFLIPGVIDRPIDHVLAGYAGR